MTLDRLPVGQEGRVRELLPRGGIRQRLMDMGLIEGTKICCVRKSPGGDPVIFCFRDTMIALRNEDSVNVLVEDVGI